MTFGDVKKFRELSSSAALGAILMALKIIIAPIHTAEAQVCANWVARRKSVVLLAPLIYFPLKVSVTVTLKPCSPFSTDRPPFISFIK